jgi:hypothetical protein
MAVRRICDMCGKLLYATGNTYPVTQNVEAFTALALPGKFVPKRKGVVITFAVYPGGLAPRDGGPADICMPCGMTLLEKLVRQQKRKKVRV